MNNTIFDIDLTRALPPTLKNDETMLALAQVIGAELQENSRLARLNIIYARIDELPENVLDILAYDLHVDWYEYGYPIATKRQIIKDSVKVHKRLGTRYAVETVLSSIYHTASVAEWFEYGGKPYTFKINIDITQDGFTEEIYRKIVRQMYFYKNLRSHLDGIDYTYRAEGTVYAALAETTHCDLCVIPRLEREYTTTSTVQAGTGIDLFYRHTVRAWLENEYTAKGAAAAGMALYTVASIAVIPCLTKHIDAVCTNFAAVGVYIQIDITITPKGAVNNERSID